MAKRLALITLAVSSPLALLCCFIEAPWTPAVFGLISMAAPVAMMGLGAARAGALGRLGPLLGGLLGWLWLVALLLIHPPSAWAGRTVGGAPWSAALMLFGLWLAPMAWTTFIYVKTFSSFGPRPEDLARIRRGSGS